MEKEELLFLYLDELKEKIQKIEEKTEGQAVDIATIKTEIINIKEFLKKKNGNGKKEFYSSIVALATALVALAMTFLKGGQ